MPAQATAEPGANEPGTLTSQTRSSVREERKAIPASGACEPWWGWMSFSAVSM